MTAANKYSQLFQFLKAFYQLRETTVTNFKESQKYEALSLDQAMALPGLKSMLYEKNKSAEEPVVLKVPRPVPPKPVARPEIPDEARIWFEGDLFEVEDAPAIKAAIQLDETEKRFEDLTEEEEDLILEVEKQLSVWRLEEQEYQRQYEVFKKHKKVYDKLFSINNRIDSFSERFEFILGLGQFTWRRGSTIYNRSLLTLPLELEMTDNGMIEVRAKAEKNLLGLETDFIAGLGGLEIHRGSQAIMPFIEREDFSLMDKITSLRGEGLQAFVHAISTDAQYQDTMAPIDKAPTYPQVHFAPLLFFRERSLRNFTAIFETILEQLQDANEVSSFAESQLLNLAVFENRSFNHEGTGHAIPEEVILPKPSNEEQITIAEKIQKKPIVVVQGPPGTGKSYTIANIIPFLLSQGKRVLVTAQTDQALRALRQHLPEEFWDLVIYFLQESSSRANDLKKSVKQLQETINDFDLEAAEAQLNEQESELDQLRRRQSRLMDEIKASINADQREAHLNSHYTNDTLNNLLEQYQRDSENYGWLRDEVKAPAPESAEKTAVQLSEWLSSMNQLQQLTAPPPGFPEVDLSRLLLPDAFKSYVKTLQNYNNEIRRYPFIEELAVSAEALAPIVHSYRSLDTAISKPAPWLEKVRNECERGQTEHWRKVSQEINNLLSEVRTEKIEEIARNNQIALPNGVPFAQLRSDAKVVLEYVQGGGKLKGFLKALTLPKEIKQRQYIFEECRINGHPCLEADQLETLYHFAVAEHVLETLDNIWGQQISNSDYLSFRLNEHTEAGRRLSEFLKLFPDFQQKEKQLKEIFSGTGIQFGLESTGMELEIVLRLLELKKQFKQQEVKVTDMAVYLDSLGAFDLIQGLSNSIAQLNWAVYESQYQALETIISYQELASNCRLREEALCIHFPETINRFKQEAHFPELSEPDIIRAIYWSHAGYKLALSFGDSVNDRLKTLGRLVEDIQDCTLRLLKTRASIAFVKRTGNVDALNSNLIRWMQAVEKSRGMGKMVFQYKREAQAKLQTISEYIPCWILPMYRLAATLTPAPDSFDVVIIDEASQLGPEALFLMYIGKKVIVVGDDQQIAPEGAGISIDKQNDLIRQFLTGIPNNQFFSTKFSFFDHAYAMSGSKDGLKEHFRCMPEIIEFSNQLCYRDQGTELIPLKQFGGDRLEPLVARFVPGGYRKGKVNRPEAEAIVREISRLIEDPRYKGKTIGVISLLGTHQHVLIDDLLRQSIPTEEIIARRIISGRPADFQGDERDVIFLSLVAANNKIGNAQTRDTDKRRYNVAMSRAREQVFLFHSVRREDLQNQNDLRAKLLHYFKHFRIEPPGEVSLIEIDKKQDPPKPFDSWFEVEVHNEIVQRGYFVKPQYRVGPYSIDLVVELPNGVKVAVECDGDRFHGNDVLEADMQRELLLRRVTQFEFFRVRYSYYRFDPEDALRGLWGILEKRSQLRAATAPVPALEPQPVNGVPQYETSPQIETIPEPVATAYSDPSSTSTQQVLVFTNQAQVYLQEVQGDVDIDTVSIEELLNGTEEEIYRLSTLDFRGYLIFGYRNGKVDKVSLSAYQTKRRVLKNAYHTEQQLLFIRHFTQAADLAGITQETKVVVFSTDIVSEHSSRGNQGNQVFVKGSIVREYKVLEDTGLNNPEYYRRNTTNSRGYYLKSEEVF